MGDTLVKGRLGIMGKRNKLSPDEKKLIRRYLVWCYKTTKEELDRIDRYFTQLKVDNIVLRQLLTEGERVDDSLKEQYRKKVDEFKGYMRKKEENVLSKKYSDPQHKKFNPDYVYLKNRLSGIEKAVGDFFGQKGLENIHALYEAEMTRRILEAREHT